MITTTLIAATLGAVIYDQGDLTSRNPVNYPTLHIGVTIQDGLEPFRNAHATIHSSSGIIEGTTTLDGSTMTHTDYAIGWDMEGEHASPRPLLAYNPDALAMQEYHVQISMRPQTAGLTWHNPGTWSLTPRTTSLDDWNITGLHDDDFSALPFAVDWTIIGPESIVSGTESIAIENLNGATHTYAYHDFHPMYVGLVNTDSREIFRGEIDGAEVVARMGAGGRFQLVPEPSAAILLLLGLATLAACRRC